MSGLRLQDTAGLAADRRGAPPDGGLPNPDEQFPSFIIRSSPEQQSELSVLTVEVLNRQKPRSVDQYKLLLTLSLSVLTLRYEKVEDSVDPDLAGWSRAGCWWCLMRTGRWRTWSLFE